MSLYLCGYISEENCLECSIRYKECNVCIGETNHKIVRHCSDCREKIKLNKEKSYSQKQYKDLLTSQIIISPKKYEKFFNIDEDLLGKSGLFITEHSDLLTSQAFIKYDYRINTNEDLI